MKNKVKNVIVLCLAVTGLIILVCCIFCENTSPFLLPLGMLYVTAGNLTHGIFIYRQKKWNKN